MHGAQGFSPGAPCGKHVLSVLCLYYLQGMTGETDKKDPEYLGAAGGSPAALLMFVICMDREYDSRGQLLCLKQCAVSGNG